MSEVEQAMRESPLKRHEIPVLMGTCRRKAFDASRAVWDAKTRADYVAGVRDEN